MTTPAFRINWRLCEIAINTSSLFLIWICKNISAFERHILTLIQEVKDSVVEMRKDIAILMATQQTQMKTGGEISAPEELPEGIYPLDTTEDVAALESKLVEDASLTQLLVSTCGDSIYS